MAVEPNGPGGQVKELRLALVLYGGVSLAVYMHGITKELHRLVRASAPEAGGPRSRPPRASGCGGACWAGWPRRRRGSPPASWWTSWPEPRPGGSTASTWPRPSPTTSPRTRCATCGSATGRSSGLLRGPRFLPGWSKSITLPLALRRAPLDGASMCGWLHDALVTMDATAAAPAESLMPDGHELQLFVTMTDLRGYERDVVADDPHIIRERQHAHVMSFRYQPRRDVDDFGPRGNAALAFGARATSCFPGAFPPVSPRSVSELLRDAGRGRHGDLAALFRLQELAGRVGGDPLTSRFIDGGVLDNRPFEQAIRAIRSRRADTEVRPAAALRRSRPASAGRGAAPAVPDAEPAEIRDDPRRADQDPRQQPILGALLEVATLNDRVARIAELVTASFEPIARQVAAVVGGAVADVATAPDAARLAEWRRLIHERASEGSGRLAYWTYARMKLADAVEGYARTVCTALDYPIESNHAQLVRGALRAWARDRGLFAEDPERLLGERGELLSAEQVDFLRTFDIGYGARLLRFVLAGLNAWYAHAGEPGYPGPGGPRRREGGPLGAGEAARRAGGGAHVRPRGRGRDRADVPGPAHRRPHPPHHAERRRLRLDARGGPGSAARGGRRRLRRGPPGFQRRDHGRDPHPDARLAGRAAGGPLVRYLGYPLWDAVLFPVQRLSDAGSATGWRSSA